MKELKAMKQVQQTWKLYSIFFHGKLSSRFEVVKIQKLQSIIES
jgi:hypothetical protein